MNRGICTGVSLQASQLKEFAARVRSFFSRGFRGAGGGEPESEDPIHFAPFAKSMKTRISTQVPHRNFSKLETAR
jgi:hypothetical protein